MNAGSAESVPTAVAVTGRHRVPHTAAPARAVPRRQAIRLAVAVVTAGAVAVVCLVVDGRGGLVAFSDLRNQLGDGFTVYSLDHVLLAAALLLAGIGLACVRAREPWTALVAIAGLVSAQLAGLGSVAVRRWPAFRGSHEYVSEGPTVRSLALVTAVVCAVAAVACLVVLLRVGERHRHALLVSVPLGTVVAVGIPLLAPGGSADLGDRVALAVMYGVPLGAALVLTALLADTAAAAVAAAVIISASLLPMSRAFVDQADLDLVIGLVAVSSLATVALRPRGARSARGGAHRVV